MNKLRSLMLITLLVIPVVVPACANHIATEISLTATPNPTESYRFVTLSAAVSAIDSNVFPTGLVTFKADGQPLPNGQVPLSDQGTAEYVTSALLVGTHNLTVEYGGDKAFTASSSQAVLGIVNKAATVMGLVPSEIATLAGQPVPISVTVQAVLTGSGIYGAPTGVVIFYEGPVTLGTAELGISFNSAARATYVAPSLSAGDHQIMAEYLGNSSYSGSVSPAFPVYVADISFP